jgi:hypothetical protein
MDAVRHRDLPVDVAARELKSITKPSDTLLVWGYEPWLFSSTHLRSALRYPTTQYIYDSPYQYSRVGPEIVNGIQATKPNFIVVTPWEYDPPRLAQPDRWKAEFVGILAKNYSQVWQADGFTIYELQATGPPHPES